MLFIWFNSYGIKNRFNLWSLWIFEILKFRKKYSEWENLDPWRNVELTGTSGRITMKLTSEFTPNKYVSDIQPKNWCDSDVSSLNSCAHYFSNSSCAHICHACDKALESAHRKHFSEKQSQQSIVKAKNCDETLDIHQFPLDFRWNFTLKFSLKKFYCTKSFVLKFQRGLWSQFYAIMLICAAFDEIEPFFTLVT